MLLKPVCQQEEQARQEFLRARQQAEAAQAALGKCRGAMAAHDQWARAAILAGGDGAALAHYRQCVAELAETMSRGRGNLARMRETLGVRRDEMVRWMKQRKALEQLVGRLEAKAAADRARSAARELDQLHAAQTFWRSEDPRAGRERPLSEDMGDPILEARMQEES